MNLKDNVLVVAETILQNKELFKEYLETLKYELVHIRYELDDINIIEAWETWTTIQIHNRDEKYRDISSLIEFEFDTLQINDMTIYVDENMNIVGPNHIINQIEEKLYQIDALFRELSKL